jgi:FKBP-type peptidyl-prolyl cis-trans isomerase (trigger factor)
MNVTVNPVDQHKVTLTIEVPAKEVTKGIAQAVKRIAGQVNIPGFRKGKAPRRILEMNFGKMLFWKKLLNYWQVVHIMKHCANRKLFRLANLKLNA